jgi:hypothetical protein
MPQLAGELSEKSTEWGRKTRKYVEKAGVDFLKIGRSTFDGNAPFWRQKPHTGEYRITRTQAGERKRRGKRPV